MIAFTNWFFEARIFFNFASARGNTELDGNPVVIFYDAAYQLYEGEAAVARRVDLASFYAWLNTHRRLQRARSLPPVLIRGDLPVRLPREKARHQEPGEEAWALSLQVQVLGRVTGE